MATRTKVRPSAAATHAPKPAPQKIEESDRFPGATAAEQQHIDSVQRHARQPEREEVREQRAQPDTPIVEGRAVAFNRSGQMVQRASAGSGVDRFALPPGLPPPGWSWEWKAEVVLGQKQEQHLGELALVGWEPVMYESYPGKFAPVKDDQGNQRKGAVRREGMLLMERAMVLTKEAQDDERKRADEKVGSSKRQYSASVAEEAARLKTAAFDQTAQQASYIRTATETLPPLNTRQQVD